MNSEALMKIQDGVNTAYVDYRHNSEYGYRPQFVSNNYREGKKVLSSIENELLKCDSFQISVAFITMGGITPLLQTLKELEQKGIKGQILTTNYLNFSEPRALEKLHSLSNITLKMFDIEEAGEGFHTKGYIFKKEEIYRIIIGSSNMTSAALTSNREWNTKVISTEQGEMAREILAEFDELWKSKYSLDYDDFYELYETRYKIIKEQRRIAALDRNPSLEKYKLKPNSMQVGFIANLRRIVELGEDRALLISATGTGKTYASAFAMRELGYKRVLFLVHRGELARQTIKSYKRVFDNKVSMGLVGSGGLDYEADYVFATIQTLSKDWHLEKYDPEEFDCIILDEAHHSPAKSYQKIMDYFKPSLWLGMTATPDKRDDNEEGRNVYELFNYQIAYEIRLQHALEDNLLCPFHYFGINDITLEDEDEMTTRKITEREFRMLTSDERVKNIIEQAEYYGYSGDRVKGLIFCSRIEESIELSRKLNEHGYRTIALNGDASPEKRADAFERLAIDEDKAKKKGITPLDYIVSVEILNEGVDIVEVNQVIMLRPTQSPIVFIQQLGRGLRKAEGKEYVVILDFIGNYKNNFMIPIALSGDRTYNKDNVRRYVISGNNTIPGASTVHFDEVSRKRIFAAVDNANFSDIKLIRENYTNLKNKLGHIPALIDFDLHGEMDVQRIFDNKSIGSYYKFLVKYEKEYKIRLSEFEDQIIEFVSRKLANGKRVYELELLKRMIAYYDELPSFNVMTDLEKQMVDVYGQRLTQNQIDNIVNVMTNEFPAGSGKKTYADCVFLEKSRDKYVSSKKFIACLRNPDFRRVLLELVEFGISRYERDYANSYRDSGFVLYQKYVYEDVCRILNWEHNEVPLNIGGYKFDKKTKTFPVFINYDKSDDISKTIMYEDHFTSSDSLIAISKSKRTVESEDVQNFIKADERGINVELFVRKNKDDKMAKEFYYLGRMHASGHTEEFIMDGTDVSAVEIGWNLEVPVREDIYEYIVN